MIWLIGNKGLLGSDVELLLNKRNMEYIATDIEVNITNYDMLFNFVKDKTIDWIVNCSAYTAVDKAEDEPELAFKVNADGVLNIAKMCKLKKTNLIHISTDYVFDGEKVGSYTEDDVPNPLNIYGKSKLKGEINIQNILKNYFIIRTSWLYGKNGNNFVYTMLRLFNEKKEVKVVNDQYGSPTYSLDLANVILKIVKTNSDKFGIYHFANEGKTTWYGFSKKIYEYAIYYHLLNNKVELIPVSTREFPTKAKRPQNSYLSKDKIKNTFNLNIRNWPEALIEFVSSLKKCE